MKEAPTATTFISPTKGPRDLTEVVQDIVDYLEEDDTSQYRLVIGTDSHERYIKKQKHTNFISAVVVHRIGKGGRYFWKNGTHTPTHSLRDKIYRETMLSLELAGELVPLLNRSLEQSHNWDLEIHVDVGQVGETKDMLKEVIGMVIGNGYKVKAKPDSYAATSIADKHTRKN